MPERFILKCDDDVHWYCIPMRLENSFESDLQDAINQDDYSDFNLCWSDFMLNSHLSCYSFVGFRKEH